MKKKILKKARGESLVEVVAALAIVSIVLIGAYSALSNAMRSNVSTSNRIVALNLAREGLEGVRNVRDTNWLVYFGSRRDNWDCYEALSGACISHFSSSEEYFRIDPFASDILQKRTGAAVLDIENESDEFEYFRVKWNDPENEPGRYEHSEGTETKYYRQISVQKEVNDNCISGTFNNCRDQRLKVVSRVQWEEESGVQEFILQTYLYDFFERDSYTFLDNIWHF